MKLCITCLIFIISVGYFEPVFGQFNLGIHGGVNISSLTPQLANSGSVIDDYQYSYSKSLNGYYLGLFTRLKLDKYLSLLIDCSYTQNGYETYSVDFAGPPGVYHSLNNIYIHFVEPQAIVEYGLPLGTGKMILGAGFNVTVPVSGKEELHGNIIEKINFSFVSIDTVLYNNNFSKKISAGIVGMLRYEFNFGLFFEILYKYQFSAQPYYILDANILGTAQSSTSLNLNVFEFGTGFTFQFKKKGE